MGIKGKRGGAQPGGGRPTKENLLEGFYNLETGEKAIYKPSPYFPSMKAAAHALKIDYAILSDARSKDCPAFRNGSMVHREMLIKWLKENPPIAEPAQPQTNFADDEQEDYNPKDEAGGVGQTLKSLQAYERWCKKRLDEAERNTANLLQPVKEARVKSSLDAWLKVTNTLLKYDLSVALAKRESGELIPIADAIDSFHGFLAWDTVANSDALRNAIPECEGKNKYEIAAVLDKALRSSSYRNYKLGMKLGKIADWMGKTASDYVKEKKPLTLYKE